MRVNQDGFLHLIIGPMFAGKSSHLIRVIRRLKAIDIPVFVIKPSIDNRYSETHVASHDNVKVDCFICDKLKDALKQDNYKQAKVVIVEEAQFFKDAVKFVKNATDKDKKHVIVYGLNGDYRRKPFGNILRLTALANKINKLDAYCYFCKNSTPADYTLKEKGSSERIEIGATDIYKPVCRKHYLEKTQLN